MGAPALGPSSLVAKPVDTTEPSTSRFNGSYPKTMVQQNGELRKSVAYAVTQSLLRRSAPG
jgi:hypothetical protein